MKSKRKMRLVVTICCCIVALVLLPTLLIYANLTDNQLKAYITQTLDEISEHNVESINSKISSDLILIEEIAERLSASDKSTTEQLEELAKTSGQHNFKRMGIVYKNGMAYSTDGFTFNADDEVAIKKAFLNENVVSDVFADKADGKQIFLYASPIFNKNDPTIKAVLFATCDVATFRNRLSESAFDGKGYSYIVKANGDTVTDSAHPSAFNDMTNVFNSMSVSGENDDAIAQMQSDMANDINGCIIFWNTGVKKYMNYEKLGINDWYMLSVVPVDVMDATRYNIITLTGILTVVIIILTALLAIALIKAERTRSREYEKILYIDELTGGMTYAKFCIEATRIIKTTTSNAACIMADLDNFKLINNLYGHAEGDKTILHVYNVLNNAIGNNGIIARRFSDRFYGLILFDDEEDLNNKLNSLATKLKNSWNSRGDADYNLNIAIGVCIVDDSDDIESAMNNATIAHDNININCSHIAFYDDVERDRMKSNKALEDKMEFAHKNHEFVPFVQPKFDAQTGKICGAEALVRWKASDGKITYPDRFIPLAERNGFIRVLDRDMFEAVCKLQRQITDSGLPVVPISVNVSRQLMYESAFADDYAEIIKQYRLSPEIVELEITESVLFDDFEGFRTIINSLRGHGFKILMDDFGTGYSSLMMLSSVPIDNLKLDKSFIDRFEDDKGRKIINCVIDLAKSLGVPITAEGVETREQCEFLKEKGCDIIQGYFFSKPVPQDAFVEMLKIENDISSPLEA